MDMSIATITCKWFPKTRQELWDGEREKKEEEEEEEEEEKKEEEKEY